MKSLFFIFSSAVYLGTFSAIAYGKCNIYESGPGVLMSFRDEIVHSNIGGKKMSPDNLGLHGSTAKIFTLGMGNGSGGLVKIPQGDGFIYRVITVGHNFFGETKKNVNFNDATGEFEKVGRLTPPDVTFGEPVREYVRINGVTTAKNTISSDLNSSRLKFKAKEIRCLPEMGKVMSGELCFLELEGEIPTWLKNEAQLYKPFDELSKTEKKEYYKMYLSGYPSGYGNWNIRRYSNCDTNESSLIKFDDYKGSYTTRCSASSAVSGGPISLYSRKSKSFITVGTFQGIVEKGVKNRFTTGKYSRAVSIWRND